jgi:hypothetical protein
VLRAVDPLYGLVALRWDVSLRLQYAMEVVGKAAIKQGFYFNEVGRIDVT